MAKKEIATFLGPQFAFSVLEKHAYLYTGSLEVSTSETDLGETTTGNYYLVGSWQPVLFDNTTDDIIFHMYFNGQKVASTMVTSTKDYSPYEEVNIIIPPYTSFKLTGENTGSGSKNVGSIVLGRIY